MIAVSAFMKYRDFVGSASWERVVFVLIDRRNIDIAWSFGLVTYRICSMLVQYIRSQCDS